MKFDVVVKDSDIELGRKQVKRLPRGAVKTVSIPFTPLQSGKREIRIIVDEENSLSELIKSDNTCISSLNAIQPSAPELIITDVKMSRLAANNNVIVVCFSVMNLGKGTAEDFQVDVSMDDKQVYWKAINDLVGSESKQLMFKTSVESKKFDISIFADRYQAVGEVNTENNIWAEMIRLKKLK